MKEKVKTRAQMLKLVASAPSKVLVGLCGHANTHVSSAALNRLMKLDSAALLWARRLLTLNNPPPVMPEDKESEQASIVRSILEIREEFTKEVPLARVAPELNKYHDAVRYRNSLKSKKAELEKELKELGELISSEQRPATAEEVEELNKLKARIDGLIVELLKPLPTMPNWAARSVRYAFQLTGGTSD